MIMNYDYHWWIFDLIIHDILTHFGWALWRHYDMMSKSESESKSKSKTKMIMSWVMMSRCPCTVHCTLCTYPDIALCTVLVLIVFLADGRSPIAIFTIEVPRYLSDISIWSIWSLWPPMQCWHAMHGKTELALFAITAIFANFWTRRRGRTWRGLPKTASATFFLQRQMVNLTMKAWKP